MHGHHLGALHIDSLSTGHRYLPQQQHHRLVFRSGRQIAALVPCALTKRTIPIPVSPSGGAGQLISVKTRMVDPPDARLTP
jgi:hypothetical protein